MLLVLDGGSTAVLDHVPETNHAALFASPLWTSQALYDYPHAVDQMHLSYLEAGSDLISCMTYQQSDMTMRHLNSATEDVWDAGMRRAVGACKIHGCGKAVLTLGTYAAMLGNGAEYCHAYVPEDKAMLTAFHTVRLQKFLRAASWSAVEYLAFETLPDVYEAFVILDVLQSIEVELRGKSVWISFSCTGSDAADRVTKGLEELLADERIALLFGVGINCFKEDVNVVDNVAKLIKDTHLHLVVYPDNGEVWDPVKRQFTGTPKTPDQWAVPFKKWSRLNDGRVVLGGCCQTTPEHIAAIRRHIAAT